MSGHLPYQRNGKFRGFIILLLLPFAVLGGCNEQERAKPHLPPAVRVQAAKATVLASSVTLTGDIAARAESALGFKIAGRIVSRNVDIGDHVLESQLLAMLDSTQQMADVRAANAGLASAEASLREARATFQRQSELLTQGFTTKAKFDNAKQALDGATARLDRVTAELGRARDALDNTQLRASLTGVVTGRSVEVGQVVSVAQQIYTIAQDGPRDAVFDVSEDLLAGSALDRLVEIMLTSDPSISAVGVVREVAPTVDAGKSTVRVKIGIDDPHPELSFGAAVNGVFRSTMRNAVVLPWTAFFEENGNPAVWVVDPETKAVSLKPVKVDSYRTGELVISSGLSDGELVVVRGVQLLWPGLIVTFQNDGVVGHTP